MMDLPMEISVSCCSLSVLAFHGLQWSHTTVLFQSNTIAEKVLSWCFRCSRQHWTHHHCQGGNLLTNILSTLLASTVLITTSAPMSSFPEHFLLLWSSILCTPYFHRFQYCLFCQFFECITHLLQNPSQRLSLLISYLKIIWRYDYLHSLMWFFFLDYYS